MQKALLLVQMSKQGGTKPNSCLKDLKNQKQVSRTTWLTINSILILLLLNVNYLKNGHINVLLEPFYIVTQ